MSERVAVALEALRAMELELETVVRGVTDADWQRQTAAEQWPVALVAFHIARGFQRQAEFIEAALRQEGPHQFSWDETNALNATIASAHPSPSRDQVVALARSSVERIAVALGVMNEAALARPAFVNDGRERDAVWVAGRLATEHARQHLESIASVIAAPSRVIFMKVGLHLGEAWESILRRKLVEERAIGFAHWGYGGTVCHPIKQVQPFATEDGDPVQVLMIRTSSDFFGDATPAVTESQDGKMWRAIPAGVVTTGKYALILRLLRPTEEQVDLGTFEVGIGPKAGSPLNEYLRGRVDKACARASKVPAASAVVQLVLRAELVPPYAVMLRSS